MVSPDVNVYADMDLVFIILGCQCNIIFIYSIFVSFDL